MVMNAVGWCWMVARGWWSTVLKVLDVCGFYWASLDVLQQSLMVFDVAGLHRYGAGWF